MPQLVQLQVNGLLGEFDHKIDLLPEWQFVILHGPNGVGKTKILELIKAVFDANFVKISQVPFGSAIFTFDDQSVLSLVNGLEQLALPGLDRPLSDIEMHVALSRPNVDDLTWTLKAPIQVRQPRAVRQVLNEYSYMEQVGPDLFRDTRDGELIDTEELIDRYAHRYADAAIRVRQSINLTRDMPNDLREYFDSLRVHLIDTQRLLTRERDPEVRANQRQTVLSFARDIRRRLQKALAENSRTSQRLDRTFPRRLLDREGSPQDLTDELIRDRYDEQNKLRTSLADLAVLDAAPDLPLPSRALEDWEQRVLWTYLDDTEKKLATFQTLLSRVTLLRSIINGRFLRKVMDIDPQQGFKFRTQSGREIDAVDLSSGEQHELVLTYDLLFNVEPNTLVLIDEPEISLHVAWQQQFLDDLVQISSVSSLRFVVATHSPQIVHKWWDRTIALAPEADN